MSQGLRRTGGASREDIQGRLSNAGRRLRRDAAFERVREDTGVHTWGTVSARWTGTGDATHGRGAEVEGGAEALEGLGRGADHG